MRLVPYDYYKIRFHISKEKSFRFRLHFIGHVPAWLVQCINQTAIRLHRWCGCCVLRKSECSPLFFFFSLLACTLLYFTSFISTAIYMQRIEILKIVNCTFCILDDVLKLSIVLFCYDTDDKN